MAEETIDQTETPEGGAPAPRTAATLIDPAAVMRIRSMQMRARIVVEGFWHGIHRSPYHGFSVEFTEYRQYTQGDDLRFVDWRVLARSDRVFIKKFEDETNLRCHLLVDHSRSMAFGSGAYEKARYAATLAATLAYFLSTQGDAVGLTTFDTGIDEYLPPRNRPGHLRRIMHALDRTAGGRGTDLAGPLDRVAELLNKRGLIVLFSDFLAPLDGLKRSLSDLHAAGHEMIVFALQDPAEVTFAFEDAARYVDMETGREMFIDPAAARKEYTARMEAHYAELAASCASLGVDYHRVTTDTPFELLLFEFLSDRARRSSGAARVRRARSTGGAVL